MFVNIYITPLWNLTPHSYSQRASNNFPEISRNSVHMRRQCFPGRFFSTNGLGMRLYHRMSANTIVTPELFTVETYEHTLAMMLLYNQLSLTTVFLPHPDPCILMRELKQTHIITAHMNICRQDSLSAFTMRRYREWCNDPQDS